MLSADRSGMQVIPLTVNSPLENKALDPFFDISSLLSEIH